jgi:hypothetical protein
MLRSPQPAFLRKKYGITPNNRVCDLTILAGSYLFNFTKDWGKLGIRAPLAKTPAGCEEVKRTF